MRLIDADKLIEDIEREFDGVCTYDVSPSQAVSDFIEIADRQPTIQPQGIDKDRLIEELESIASRYPYKVVGQPETYGEYNMAWQDCIDVVEQAIEKTQPTSDGWIPCDYAVPSSPATEDTFRDILIKRKTGKVVAGWYNLGEDTWMEQTEDYGIGVRLTDAIEWKYPQPYKESE